MTIELLNMDCMDYLRDCPDKAFDLAIVDPPYGINAPNMQMGQNLNRDDGWKRSESSAVKIKKGRLSQGSGKLKNCALNTMNCSWDFQPPDREYFRELFRVSRHQIIWGGNYFDLPPTRCVVCWDKVQPWENFSQWEMAWTSFGNPAAMIRISNTGGNNKDIKIHPTQKPVELYNHLYKKFANPGWQVIDTHLGSGSSAIAAHYAGCDFVGIEIDKAYFESAKKRVSDMTAQQTLGLSA